MVTKKSPVVEVHRVAKVFVDVEALCGSFGHWTERVYGLTYGGKTIFFRDLQGVHNRSGNPNYNDPVATFDSKTLTEFIDEPWTWDSFDNRPSDKGDFLTGFIMQLGGHSNNSTIECATTGQGGEQVMFELPLRDLPAFRQRLNKLLKKLKALEFYYEPDDED